MPLKASYVIISYLSFHPGPIPDSVVAGSDDDRAERRKAKRVLLSALFVTKFARKYTFGTQPIEILTLSHATLLVSHGGFFGVLYLISVLKTHRLFFLKKRLCIAIYTQDAASIDLM